MNLVQKLPIGVGLACAIMLSSCSKEDVIVPTAGTSKVDNSSNMRGGTLAAYLPHFSTTYGPTGRNIHPVGWTRTDKSHGSDDIDGLPTGTSSLTHLFGDQAYPWDKPLPVISNSTGVRYSGSIVTVTTNRSNISSGNNSTAMAKVRNLKPGKTYQITLYVASTRCSANVNGFVPSYATEIYVSLWGVYNNYTHVVDVEGKEAEWIKKTISFQAIDTQMTVSFHANTPDNGYLLSSDNGYSYAHMFVDEGAIKQID